jgi:hypothetical protein
MYNPDRFLQQQPVPPANPIPSIIGGAVSMVGFLAFAGDTVIAGIGLNWSFELFFPVGMACIVIGAGIIFNRLWPRCNN